MIRGIGVVLALAVVGFSAGRLASAPLRSWLGRTEMPAPEVNPIAGWMEERARLRDAVEAARGDPAGLAEAARALVEHDPADAAARQLASAAASRSLARAAAALPAEAESGALALGTEDVREATVRELFPKREVAEAVLLHVSRGRTLRASAALRRLGETALAEAFESIDARLREAGSLLLGGKLEEAHRRLLSAREVERSVLPQPLSSQPLAEAAAAVGAAWTRAASPAFSRGELRHAAAAWRNALDADPTNLEAADGLRRLERRATELLAGAPSCAELAELAASLDPASPSQPDAIRRAAACGRRGQVGSVISPR